MLDVIRLFVPHDKMKATRAFYADGLGLDRDPASATPNVFLLGDLRLQLVSTGEVRGQHAFGLRLQVCGLKECIEQLVADGYISGPPASPRSDDAAFEISDPAGHRIVLHDVLTQ